MMQAREEGEEQTEQVSPSPSISPSSLPSPSTSPLTSTSPSPLTSISKTSSQKTGQKRRNENDSAGSKKPKIGGQTIYHMPRLHGVNHNQLEETLAALLVAHPAKNTNQSDLVRIFYAIASPDALYQLKDVCIAARRQNRALPRDTTSIAHTIQALDGCDTLISSQSILRRYYLSRLASHRNKLLDQHDGKLGSTRSSTRKNVKKYSDRCETIVLEKIVAEGYPLVSKKSNSYTRKKSSLQFKLKCGRRWLEIEENFGAGIFPLIPIGGHYHITQNE
ncbi:uncharacterized protein BDZ99DRAFT_243195 [Mytilinidion resinicola]|uniref:Uncharacterized protein n=1 Tax=Mytilinidion resinicola TaxID=574789 RepID=A0A6A6YVL8_9PEZI|nr:uncharacterized protein BDZ99DRAFT_243195 [Mytilinidion resinicola]KAF2812810.1 hypothetical protein BDZ99DRAFT_243195 [Mytilinidion resinicola]